MYNVCSIPTVIELLIYVLINIFWDLHDVVTDNICFDFVFRVNCLHVQLYLLFCVYILCLCKYVTCFLLFFYWSNIRKYIIVIFYFTWRISRGKESMNANLNSTLARILFDIYPCHAQVTLQYHPRRPDIALAETFSIWKE